MIPDTMENTALIEQMLRQLADKIDAQSDKIDTLFAKVNDIRLEASQHQAKTTESLLNQARTFDEKLISLERRFDEKMHTRAEKVDRWFDEMQESFSLYKTANESRMAALSVKVGAASGFAGIVVGAVITAIFRYLIS